MTPPKDRDALIEVMETAIAAAYKIHHGQPFLGLVLVNAALTALESSGCFVGPVVATETMLSVGEEAIFITCQSSVNETDACWTAMQSANPYRKE